MPAGFSDDEDEDGHRQYSDGRTYRAIQLEKPSENANVQQVNNSAKFGGQVDSCDVRVVQRILKKNLKPVCIELRLSPNAHTLNHKTLVSLLADYNMVRLYRAGEMTPAHKQVAEKNIAQYNDENNIKETYNRFQDDPEEADAVPQRETAGGGGAGAVPVGSVLKAVDAVKNDTTPPAENDSDSESSIEYLMPWISQTVIAYAVSSVGSTANPTHTPAKSLSGYAAAVAVSAALSTAFQPTGLHANRCKYAQSEITCENISRHLCVVVAHFATKCAIDFFAMLSKFIMLQYFHVQHAGFLKSLRAYTKLFQIGANSHEQDFMCGMAGNELASKPGYGLWSLATACTSPTREAETYVVSVLIVAIWTLMTVPHLLYPLKNTNLKYLEMCKAENDQSKPILEDNCYVSFIVSSPTAAFAAIRDDTNVTSLTFNTKTYNYFAQDKLLSDWLCDNLDAFPGPDLPEDTFDSNVEAFVLNDFFKTEDAYCQSIMKILFANVVSEEDGIMCPAELLYTRIGTRTEIDLLRVLATAGVTAFITGAKVVASLASVGRALVVGSPEPNRRNQSAQPPAAAAKPAPNPVDKARAIVKGAVDHWCEWVSNRENIKQKITDRLTARSVVAKDKGWNAFYKIINDDEKQNLLRDERAALTEAQTLENELQKQRRNAEYNNAQREKLVAEAEYLRVRTEKAKLAAAKDQGE